MRSLATALPFVLAAALACPATGHAQGFFFSGFGKLTGATDAGGAAGTDSLYGQVQAGLVWSPKPALRAVVHLVAQTDDGDSERGEIGVAEAYLEGNVARSFGHLRFRAGAIFLPTSFENVDALWENPYLISSSALNTWLGEELRPVGIDAAWFHGPWMAGATVFQGNDSFGALPAVRGWAPGDRWTLLGEKVPVNHRAVTSVTAENDDRLGWSARAGWQGARFAAQATYVDNRSDARIYGPFYNWDTQFRIVGAQYASGDWTLAGEIGWGPSRVAAPFHQEVVDLGAGYVLASRRIARGRVSARLESYRARDQRDEAFALGYSWTTRARLGVRGEVLFVEPETRALLQLRYAL